MGFCFCRFIFPILVIVFAWWAVSWAPVALTIIGVILLFLGVKRDFCCLGKKSP